MVAEGLYYPGNRKELASQIRHVLAGCTAVPGSSVVVVGPYGSYDITLPYLVPAFRAAVAKPDVLLILAPPSTLEGAHNPPVLLPESDSFATPLGTMPVETAIHEQLLARGDLFALDEYAHLRDHSIEIMLPILHYLYGATPIIPLLVGAMDGRSLEQIAGILRTTLAGRRALTVVSANFSGFTTPREADCRSRQIMRILLDTPGTAALEPLEMMHDPPRSIWPIMVGHLLAPGGTRPEVLQRGAFETEYDDDTGSVIFAAIAYR